MGRDRAGNGGVEGGAVFKALTKTTDATSVCLVHTVPLVFRLLMSEIATDPLSPGVLLGSRTWNSCLFFCCSPLQHKKLYIRPHSHQLCKLKMSPSHVHLAYILYIHMVQCAFALGCWCAGWASPVRTEYRIHCSTHCRYTTKAS